MGVPSACFRLDPAELDATTILYGLEGEKFVHQYLSLLPHDMSRACLKYLPLFDPPSSDLNLLTAHFAALGLPVSGLWLPDLREHTSRGSSQASAGNQIGSHLKSGSFPRLVQGARTKEEHVQQALQICTLPFDKQAPLSEATYCALDAVVEWGTDTKEVRRKRWQRLRRKAKQLQKLNLELVELMPKHIRAYLSHVNLAFILYTQILLRWPDVRYAARLLYGFDTVGALDSPPIFEFLVELIFEF